MSRIVCEWLIGEDHAARMHRLLRLQCDRGRVGIIDRSYRSAMWYYVKAYFAEELAAIDGILVETGGTAFQRSPRDRISARGVPNLSTRRAAHARGPSLRLDTGELDHLGPLFSFVDDKFSELGGCHYHRFGP
jgi:hypothetical protein